MSSVDSDSKETEVLSKDEEKQLWEVGVLGCVTAQKHCFMRSSF